MVGWHDGPDLAPWRNGRVPDHLHPTLVKWRRSHPGDEGDAPPPPGPETSVEVALWRDDDGVLLAGAPEAVEGLVARLTEIGGSQLAASPVAPTEALAVFLTGYADGATSGQYVRFTDESMAMLETHGAVPNGSGGFHTMVMGDSGIVGNLEWVATGAGPERALAFQSAAIGLALRTAVKNVEAAVARVEDKVDAVAAMVRSERLGNVLGDRRTLDALVGHLDAGDPLSAADWSSVAALGPAITRDLEKLRAHLRTQVEEVDGGWRPRQRANEADGLLGEGLLNETLGLLLLAEHNFSQWQRLRIQRIADDEPDKLAAAVRQAGEAMQDHLAADEEFLRQFQSIQAEILEPRDHDGFAPRQTRALGRADNELTDLTRWFADQRLLDVDAVDRRPRPGLRDSVSGIITAGRDLTSSLPRPGRRPSDDAEVPLALADASHPYHWAVEGPPIGTWRTFEGTFSNVMANEITFESNGTGSVVQTSGLGGAEASPIRWRQVGEGVLWISHDIDGDIDEGDTDEGDTDNGDTFYYVASHRRSDAGSSPVLMNAPSEPDGWIPAGGFWIFPGPVRLVRSS